MNTRALLRILIIAGFLYSVGELLAQEQSQDSNITTALILTFDNATGQQNLDAASKTIPDLIATFLVAGTDKIRVVDRNSLDAIYEEKSLTWQGIVRDRSTLRTSALWQAKYIIRGSLIHKGDTPSDTETIEIKAFLHETESTRLLKSFEAQGPPNQLVHLCSEIASGIAGFFQAELPPIEELPLDDDPQKSMLMIHGLSAFHNGQPHTATACFLKILGDYPEDESAKFWLAKSFLAADLKTHAAIELKTFLNMFPNSDKTNEAKHLLKSIDNNNDKDQGS